ncbi:hypothetical protein F5Y10DRAFT_272535 [Nemania abortiva]|nr:hypothetical protein F5Y10DRAFT_272535 [Nemania abortiva]
MEACLGAFHAGTVPEYRVCDACRWRKVRCTPRGNNKRCVSCNRLALDCSLAGDDRDGDQENQGSIGPSSPRDRNLRARRPHRLRGATACIACRRRKVKCSGSTPSCSACQHRNEPCVYPTTIRTVEVPPVTSPQSTQSTSTDDDPEMIDCLKGLVDVYFHSIYPLPSLAFLHPATTREECTAGSMDKTLAYAICALATWHSQPNQRSQAEVWYKIAEQRIFRYLESPSLSRLQALLLIISYQTQVGLFQRAFMFVAIAARYVAAMRLTYERPNLDPTQQEVQRRTVWSLKIAERYFSVGLPEFEVCPLDTICLQYPSSERGFGCGDLGDDGAYHLFWHLEVIRHDIMKLTRAVSLCEQPFAALTGIMNNLKDRLVEIEAQLSPHTVHFSTNIGDSLLSRRQITTHISFHQAYCDLNRLLLRGYPEGAPDVLLDALDEEHIETAQHECLRHATYIVQTLTTLNQNCTSPFPLEFDTAVCAYHAARLTLFIAQSYPHSSDGITQEFAASRVDLCLVAMRRFFPQSALTKPIIDDMERLRQGEISQRTVLGGLVPATESRSGHSSQEFQLPSAAVKRQRLAIHSLLRRADFDNQPADRSPLLDYQSLPE